jgi:hypothetical protein
MTPNSHVDGHILRRQHKDTARFGNASCSYSLSSVENCHGDQGEKPSAKTGYNLQNTMRFAQTLIVGPFKLFLDAQYLMTGCKARLEATLGPAPRPAGVFPVLALLFYS